VEELGDGCHYLLASIDDEDIGRIQQRLLDLLALGDLSELNVSAEYALQQFSHTQT
jgi:hypothetical protein